MAIDFPPTPVLNETYTYGDTTWKWNGYAWDNTSSTFGPQGTQGTTGSTGAQGAQGVLGAQGTQGTIGAQGSLGTQGSTGTQGTQGVQGFDGARGLQGTQGATGVQGTQGVQGVQGTFGSQGIQGTLGTQGTQGTIGPIPAKYYAQFWDTSTQTNAGATTANPVKFDSYDSFNTGITITNNGSGVPTRVTFANAGVYNVQFSAQVYKSDAGDDTIDLWFSKNGTNIANTNGRITLSATGGNTIETWNVLIDVAANDYIEMYWHSSDLDMQLISYAGSNSPTRPAIPSIILTAFKVS